MLSALRRRCAPVAGFAVLVLLMSSTTLMMGLAAIVVLGVLAQWLSWRLRLPAILLLLLLGLLAGPISGLDRGTPLLDPDALFGDLLLPVVSLAVAIILFEGALSLRWEEIRQCGWTVVAMVSVGALVTWVIVATAARVIMGLELELAIMVGAILTVTGPTVIAPLLRQLRPSGLVGPVLRWEGIVIDPIGAMFAVITLGVIAAGDGNDPAIQIIMLTMGKILLIGFGIGVPLGIGLAFVLKRYWVPDYLQNPLTLGVVLIAFAISNLLADESGLLTVTVIGAVLANIKDLRIGHIIEFKENLQVLLISSLFIVLAARLDLEAVLDLGWAAVGFLAVVLLVARPASVFASTFAARNLTVQERILLSWIAPRGIVAAAVSAIIALELHELGYESASAIVALVFVVIIGTVAIHGITAYPLALALGITQANPQGCVIAGADRVGRRIAEELDDLGFEVVVVDTNPNNLFVARRAGLETHQGNVLSEQVLEQLDLTGMGRLLSVTGNDEVNALATLHFLEVFGRRGVLQLHPSSAAQDSHGEGVRVDLRGRQLFGAHATHSWLRDRFAQGATIERVRLEGDLDWSTYLDRYGEAAMPMFCVNEPEVTMMVFTEDSSFSPRMGNTIIHLIHQGGPPLGSGYVATPPRGATSIGTVTGGIVKGGASGSSSAATRSSTADEDDADATDDDEAVR